METRPAGVGGETTDCADSLKELYTFLDGELTAERRLDIRAHLEGCLPCYEAFDFEAELRMVVSTRCRDEVPDELRARVAEALRRCQQDDTTS
jgi:mycothiol system anti-sigma-R factor